MFVPDLKALQRTPSLLSLLQRQSLKAIMLFFWFRFILLFCFFCLFVILSFCHFVILFLLFCYLVFLLFSFLLFCYFVNKNVDLSSSYKEKWWFKETFENTRWRKVKQMQPMLIFLAATKRNPILGIDNLFSCLRCLTTKILWKSRNNFSMVCDVL